MGDIYVYIDIHIDIDIDIDNIDIDMQVLCKVSLQRLWILKYLENGLYWDCCNIYCIIGNWKTGNEELFSLSVIYFGNWIKCKLCHQLQVLTRVKHFLKVMYTVFMKWKATQGTGFNENANKKERKMDISEFL